ncbi:MAG: hypothetical protein FD123_1486 [Bacteroidetes bacterium]|nr:MAG: hypothetical protein FD123_1486 [Bacteroidota bacterium]
MRFFGMRIRILIRGIKHKSRENLVSKTRLLRQHRSDDVVQIIFTCFY